MNSQKLLKTKKMILAFFSLPETRDRQNPTSYILFLPFVYILADIIVISLSYVCFNFSVDLNDFLLRTVMELRLLWLLERWQMCSFKEENQRNFYTSDRQWWVIYTYLNTCSSTAMSCHFPLLVRHAILLVTNGVVLRVVRSNCWRAFTD